MCSSFIIVLHKETRENTLRQNNMTKGQSTYGTRNTISDQTRETRLHCYDLTFTGTNWSCHCGLRWLYTRLLQLSLCFEFIVERMVRSINCSNDSYLHSVRFIMIRIIFDVCHSAVQSSLTLYHHLTGRL